MLPPLKEDGLMPPSKLQFSLGDLPPDTLLETPFLRGPFPHAFVLDSLVKGKDFEAVAAGVGEVETGLASLSDGGVLGFFKGCCLAVGFDVGFAGTTSPGEDGVLFPAAGRRTGLPSESAMFRVALTLAAPDMDRLSLLLLQEKSSKFYSPSGVLSSAKLLTRNVYPSFSLKRFVPDLGVCE